MAIPIRMDNHSGYSIYYRASDNSSYYTTLIVISSAVAFVNCLVILTFMRYQNLRRHNNNLMVLSLSIADFVAGFSSLVCCIILQTTKPMTTNNEVVYIVLPLSVTVNGSAFTLVCMTIDRLLSITCPMRYIPMVTNTRLVTCLSFVWLLPLSMGAICIGIESNNRSSMKILFSFAVSFNSFSTTVLCISNIILFNISRKSKANLKVKVGDAPTISNSLFEITDTRMRARTNSSTMMILENSVHVPDVHKRIRAATTTTLDLSLAIAARNRSFTVQSLEVPPSLTRSESSKARAKQQLRKVKRELLTSFMCLFHVSGYVFCTFPSSVYMVGVLIDAWYPFTGFKIVTHFMLVNSMINPVIYFLKRQDFRKCFKKLFTKQRIGAM